MIELSRTHIPCTHLVALISPPTDTPRKISLVQVEAIVHIHYVLSASERHMATTPSSPRDAYTYLVRNSRGCLDLTLDLTEEGYDYVVAHAENVNTVDDVNQECSCLINMNIRKAYNLLLSSIGCEPKDSDA